MLRVGERIWYSDPSNTPPRIHVVKRVNDCAALIETEVRARKTIVATTERVRIAGRERRVPLEVPVEKEIPEKARVIAISPYSFVDRVKGVA
jgi:hypothetical protein